MKIPDLDQMASLDSLHRQFAEELENYEKQKREETSTIMDIFLTAVMKKYGLNEIRLTTLDLIEADTDWIERNKGSLTDGLLITFKGEKEKNES